MGERSGREEVEGRWILDPLVAVLPTPEGSLRVSSPRAFGEIKASPYQIQLLLTFREARTIRETLSAYPFEKAESRLFLKACGQAGLLRPADPEGGPTAPDRVPVNPCFAGAPPLDALIPPALTFLGVPFDGNTTGFPGARFGPAAVRSAAEGLRYLLDPDTLQPAGFFDFAAGRTLLAGVSLADAGDVLVSPGEDGPELYARVTDVVRDLLELGTVPLIAGGDHSLTAPILAGFPAAPLQVLHLDAHTDLGDVDRADGTGLHHGNVFSVVLDELPHVVELRQLGLRGMVESASALARDRVTSVGMDPLREKGAEAALEGLDPDRPTYISIDIDVVDPAFAPSTGTPVAGGLYPHELKAILRAAGRRLRVVGVDVMEVAQPLGPADGTASLAMEALLHAADGILERMLGELGANQDDGDTAA